MLTAEWKRAGHLQVARACGRVHAWLAARAGRSDQQRKEAELAEKLGIDLKALLRDTKAAGEKEKVPLEAGCFEETIDQYNCSFRNRID